MKKTKLCTVGLGKSGKVIKRAIYTDKEGKFWVRQMGTYICIDAQPLPEHPNCPCLPINQIV